MPNDTQVVADGVDREVESQPSASRWTLLVVGLVVGAAIVFLFTGEADEPELVAEDQSGGELVVPNASPGVTDIAMSEAVRDFPDALVSVTRTESDTFEFLIWPRDGSLVMRTMSGGDTATFDAASQYLAMTSVNSTLPGFSLAVGRHTQLRPAVPIVRSFAWHDTDSGHLAFTTEQSDGEWTLWHLPPNLRSEPIVSEFRWRGEIVAWGDWGWAVQSDDGILRLLTPDAELKTEHLGVAHASDRDGWLFVVGEEPHLVSAGGGVKLLDIDLDVVGDVNYASFSNDGDMLAVSGTQATQVYDRGGELVADFGVRVNGEMVFSSDDRFVVAPAPAGVVVFDLELETRSVLLEQYSVLATSVVPVSGS